MLFKFKKSFFLFIILWGYIVSFSAVANAMSDELFSGGICLNDIKAKTIRL